MLLTGKLPRIVEAFRIEPVGKDEGLKPIAFRGQVPIDPRSQDFFKVVIEERSRLAARTDLTDAERKRLKRSLKTLGSATCYGVSCQMDRQESEKEVELICYGSDTERYGCKVKHPEAPGEFASHHWHRSLQAAVVCRSHSRGRVTDRGGTYAMEDTDSMAIVAHEHGGLIACPGGPYRMDDGSEAIRALSWEQVAEIVERFASSTHRAVRRARLNPQD